MNDLLLKDVPLIRQVDDLSKQFAQATARALQNEILSHFAVRTGIKKITPYRTKQFTQFYTQAMILSFLYGLWHSEKLEDNRIKLDKNDFKVPFDEAELFLKSLVAMPRSEYDQLDADLKYRAFTIARVSQEDIIRKIQKLYQEQLQTGDYRPELQQKLAQILEKNGVSEITPHWLETHYRNNVMNAYNAGRWEGFQQSSVIEYLIYNAIVDGHTTDLCKKLHGVVRPKNDDIWKTIAPQNHHQCRSVLGPLSARQKRERKIKTSSLDLDKLYKQYPVMDREHQFRGNPAKLMDTIPASLAKRADKYKVWHEIHAFMKGSVSKEYWDSEITKFKDYKGIDENSDIWLSSYRRQNGEAVRALSFGKKVDGGYKIIQVKKGVTLKEKFYTEKDIKSMGWAKLQQLKIEQPVITEQKWKHIPNTQLGTNPGGQFIGPDGHQYYVKFYNNQQQAHSEYLANNILDRLNINTVDMRLEQIEFNGKERLGVASKWLDNLEPMKKHLTDKRSKAEDDQIIKHYLGAVLTGNWDVVGFDYDNLSRTAKKKWYCIDQGGTFRFRAQEFGPKATEFKSLLEPGRQASNVFKPVFDRTIKQNPEPYINWLKKLSAKDIERSVDSSGISDADEFKRLLIQRKSDIIEQLEAFKQTTTKRLRKKERKILKDAKKAKWQGKSIPLDGDDVEDQNLLVFEEILPDGNKQTTLRMKIRPDAEKKLKAHIGVSGPIQSDYFFDDIEKAVKNINYHHHNKDFKYNKATISNALNHLNKLKNLAENARDKNEQDMAKYYINWLSKINDAVKEQKELEAFGQFVEKSIGNRFEVKQTTVKLQKKVNTRREIIIGKNRSDLKTLLNDEYAKDGKQYEIDLENGNKVIYKPWDDQNYFALQGEFDLIIKGEINEHSIEKALDQIESIGINANISTPEDTELMYLKKQAYILKRDRQSDTYKQLISALEHKKASKTEQIKALKEFWSEELGEDITKRKEYNPAGSYQNGAGNRVQYRFDIKEREFEKEMEGYCLGHKLTADDDVVKFIDMVLENNGAMISNREKIRIGVPCYNGMSPEVDLESGGASYFFTRIRKKNDDPLELNFKIDLLKRMDAISYDHDAFGRTVGDYVSVKRKTTPNEWKQAELEGSNETFFKDTVTFIDNIETICVKNDDQKEKLLKVFKKHNIQTLPDGRNVEDIIFIGEVE